MTTRPLVVATQETTSDVKFDKTMEDRIADVLRRYPTTRAALLPVLWLCQERFGWISPGVISAVAERLGESAAFVEGVVSFYTMYYTSPPARYVLQVCTTLSCSVCGGRELVDHLTAKLGIGFGEKTPDGSFQLVGVQCLGACGNAPVIQINDDYYEDLTPKKLDAVLDDLKGRR
ncbi:MAG: NAD(P)H-dependent oxidoreductase subunit E [Acidobacteriia bacterium]|nr:NAD(P)H-dependent oxidoreductase subunit E [Terriglobia bacterium]